MYTYPYIVLVIYRFLEVFLQTDNEAKSHIPYTDIQLH